MGTRSCTASIADRGREVYRLAFDAVEGRTRPKMGLYDCRMANVYFTTAEPMRSFFYVKGPGAIMGEFERIPYRHRPLNYWPRVADPFA